MHEWRTTFAIASIFSFRLLGLFMILPVFSPYAAQLIGATPTAIGIAVGIYGLTQAALQIPFGFFSDRIGRKPMITLGLILFTAGSLLAALSHDIYSTIVGRALQGAGAIGSVLLALITDLITEKNRAKAFAITGIIIGASFSLAIILGPLLNNWMHVNGIFGVSSVLGLLAILILYTVVPTPIHTIAIQSSDASQKFKKILKDKKLLLLNVSVFLLHLILTTMFIVLPLILMNSHLDMKSPWFFYFCILTFSLFITFPALHYAEKRQLQNKFFIGAIALILISQILLYSGHQNFWWIACSLIIFFSGFNYLEASLPVIISKIVPLNMKGTAMGTYSTFQFSGIFIGGLLGGWLYAHFPLSNTFLCTAIITCFWFITTVKMKTLET